MPKAGAAATKLLGACSGFPGSSRWSVRGGGFVVAVHPQPGATVTAAANEQRPNDATTVRGRVTISFARTTHCECCISSNLAISRQHVCRGLPPCGTAAAGRRESDGQRRQRRDDGAGYRWLLGANCVWQKNWQMLWQVDAVFFCQRQHARRRRQQRRRQCAKTEETETTPTN